MFKVAQVTVLIVLALASASANSWDSEDDGAEYFGDDLCTYDCSGHEAGYAWAESNGWDDESYCYTVYGGYINNSPSFTEGCLQYLEDEGYY